MPLTEEFSNKVILPEQLFPIEDEAFNELEPKLMKLKHLTTIILIFMIACAMTLILIFGDNDIPKLVMTLVPSFFILLLIWRTFLVIKGFPKKGYLLREKDISYRKGLFFYKLTTVPFNRIQHVEVNQNFIEKIFALASIKIFTAGGSVSDVSIPGLIPEKAHEIEAFLLKKISRHE